MHRLMQELRAKFPGKDIRLAPVGEVMAQLDRRIRKGSLPGIEAYFHRNAEYYHLARLDKKASLEAARFTYFDPGESGFVREQGVKNFYCDSVHMNDQPHNGPQCGTIGAYAAAATVKALLDESDPTRFSASQVAAIYEKFDAQQDEALIRAVQETVRDVIRAEPFCRCD
jgi:hypothetical protein